MGRVKVTQDDGNEARYRLRVEEYFAEMLQLEPDKDGNIPLPKRPETHLKCASVGSGLRMPADIAEKLFPYQIRGVLWMWGLHRDGTGGILADEMGMSVVGLCSAALVKRAVATGLTCRIGQNRASHLVVC